MRSGLSNAALASWLLAPTRQGWRLWQEAQQSRSALLAHFELDTPVLVVWALTQELRDAGSISAPHCVSDFKHSPRTTRLEGTHLPGSSPACLNRTHSGPGGSTQTGGSAARGETSTYLGSSLDPFPPQKGQPLLSTRFIQRRQEPQRSTNAPRWHRPMAAQPRLPAPAPVRVLLVQQSWGGQYAGPRAGSPFCLQRLPALSSGTRSRPPPCPHRSSGQRRRAGPGRAGPRG